MAYVKNKKTKQKKHITVLIIGLALLLVLLFLIVKPKKQVIINTPATTPETKTVISTAATKVSPEDQKTSTNKPVNITKTDSGKTAVTPTILNADKNGLNGLVSGIFEDGGTCTAVFSKDGQDITVSSTGFSNANYTSCAPIKLSSPINIAGNWTVALKYSSGTAEGRSAPYSFRIE